MLWRRVASLTGSSRAFYTGARAEVVAPELRSVGATPPPARRASRVAQGGERAIAMQPVPAAAAAAAARAEREARARRRRGGLVSPREDGPTVRKSNSADGKKVKKKPRKVGARERRAAQSQGTLHLLAELPFATADADAWTELGFSGTQQGEKKKGRRAEREQGDGEEVGENEKKKKKGIPRPNYFVSFPITNQQIKQGVEQVQAVVIQKEARLARALIPPATLHVTLLVTHLATQEEVDAAALAVEEMESTLKSLMGGRSLVLPFRGVGHFRQEVAFIQIEEGEHLHTLTQIADVVRRAFEEKGIPSGDRKAFTPHLTFIKLSRAPILRRQGIKKLDPALYTAFEQHVFGEEPVCSLDLCSMLKKKEADGHYHREKSVTFGAKRGPELDDEELVSLSKRLVEDAVSRAVRQFTEETQRNGVATKNEAPPSASPDPIATK
ncbi:A-kinase anchor protein 7-like [Electrophorus electricus]|uniref:A-kinase anchoring protein 7 n=1 Tax=Electrophorus electricus TaxID=8005 RepID=A0AAY5EB15_ELEEL|nr:A-kinase anchor protein 7-like [Electrophorus electricus]